MSRQVENGIPTKVCLTFLSIMHESYGQLTACDCPVGGTTATA
jgi:hypothetical protein